LHISANPIEDLRIKGYKEYKLSMHHTNPCGCQEFKKMLPEAKGLKLNAKTTVASCVLIIDKDVNRVSIIE